MNGFASECLDSLDDGLGCELHVLMLVLEALTQEGQGVIQHNEVPLAHLAEHVLYNLESRLSDSPWMFCPGLHEYRVVEPNPKCVVVDSVNHLEDEWLHDVLNKW